MCVGVSPSLLSHRWGPREGCVASVLFWHNLPPSQAAVGSPCAPLGPSLWAGL